MAMSPECPQCGCDATFPDRDQMSCTVCSYEWRPDEASAVTEERVVVKDANGTVLNAGDTVTVIKDLKVKGSSIPLKQGTVIKNIRLVDGDAEHIEGNSEKIKGLVLKTCFLKKA